MVFDRKTVFKHLINSPHGLTSATMVTVSNSLLDPVQACLNVTQQDHTAKRPTTWLCWTAITNMGRSSKRQLQVEQRSIS